MEFTGTQWIAKIVFHYKHQGYVLFMQEPLGFLVKMVKNQSLDKTTHSAMLSPKIYWFCITTIETHVSIPNRNLQFK